MRLFLSVLMVCLFYVCTAQRFTAQDDTSEIGFEIRNFGVAVQGTIKGLSGSIELDPNMLSSSSFDVTVDAATIDTGIRMRDNHLRKEEYLHVAAFNTIRFVSTKVTSGQSAGEGFMTGRLTIKNKTKEISFPFSYSADGKSAQFEGEFEINRRDFNVGGSSMSMSDMLKVMLKVKAVG